MRKIVLTFGLIAGAILSAMLLLTAPFADAIGLGMGQVIGFTTMVLAFLLIFVGVKTYRDTVAGGTIRFGRAFLVGGLIGVVATLCYVATWEVIYFNKLAGDYAMKYEEMTLKKERDKGATEAQLAATKAKIQEQMVMYNKPLFNAAVTFLEPLPVALILSLISAGVLSRRPKSPPPSADRNTAGARLTPS
jgi:hypothetical protein